MADGTATLYRVASQSAICSAICIMGQKGRAPWNVQRGAKASLQIHPKLSAIPMLVLRTSDPKSLKEGRIMETVQALNVQMKGTPLSVPFGTIGTQLTMGTQTTMETQTTMGAQTTTETQTTMGTQTTMRTQAKMETQTTMRMFTILSTLQTLTTMEGMLNFGQKSPHVT